MDLEEFLRLLPFLEAAELMAISATYHDADVEAREAARARRVGGGDRSAA